MRTRVAATLSMAVSLLAATLAAQDFQWQGRLAPGKTLEIKGVNGAIEASAAGGEEVEVTATKHGRRSDPASVNGEIETDFPLTVTGRFSRRTLSGTIGGGGGRSLELETVNGSIRLHK